MDLAITSGSCADRARFLLRVRADSKRSEDLDKDRSKIPLRQLPFHSECVRTVKGRRVWSRAGGFGQGSEQTELFCKFVVGWSGTGWSDSVGGQSNLVGGWSDSVGGWLLGEMNWVCLFIPVSHIASINA